MDRGGRHRRGLSLDTEASRFNTSYAGNGRQSTNVNRQGLLEEASRFNNYAENGRQTTMNRQGSLLRLEEASRYNRYAENRQTNVN